MGRVLLKQVSRLYGRVKAVDVLDLDIADHTFVTLLGPFGCGKSTTLNLIAGLDKVSGGEIYLDDQLINNVPPNERRMAMVFQNYALYPHMTVAGNLSFSLRLKRRPRDEIERRVNRVAEMLDIGALLNRKPAQISGGQQQRVALGRALIKEPDVFLMDEPLSNLDAALRSRMRTEIKHLHLQLRTTTIFVTHDQEEAMSLSDLIAVMHRGKLMQYGPPADIYHRPNSLYVATFIGKPRMSLLEGELTRENGSFAFRGDGARLELDPTTSHQLEASRSSSVTAGLRAEDVRLVLDGASVADNGISARVSLIEPLGADTCVELAVGRDTLIARTPPDFRVSLGDNVRVQVPPAKVHLFDRESGARLN